MLYLPHSLSPCLACSTSCAIVPSFMRGFFPGVHFCTSCDKKTIIMRSSADNLQFNSTDVHQPCKGEEGEGNKLTRLHRLHRWLFDWREAAVRSWQADPWYLPYLRFISIVSLRYTYVGCSLPSTLLSWTASFLAWVGKVSWCSADNH